MNPQEKQVRITQIKNHIQKYSVSDNKLAFKALLFTCFLQLVAAIFINLGLGIIGWMIHSLAIMRFFVQFHDMAHYSFFASNSLNRFFGVILGIYVHFPFIAWRDGHNHHHRHFGNLDRLDLSQTILFTKKRYEQWPTYLRVIIRIFRQPIVFFIFTAPFVWFFLLIGTVFKRYGFFSWAYFQKILSLVISFFVFPYIGLPRFEMCFTVYLAQMLGNMMFHLQHSVNLPYRNRQNKWNQTEAALEGSTYLQIPSLLKYATAGIEYHHIHHLSTSVPSYRIGECHHDFEKIKGNQWADSGINYVPIKLSVISLMNVMFDEETRTLVPFSYKHL